jgi:hypothetical protein
LAADVLALLDAGLTVERVTALQQLVLQLSALRLMEPTVDTITAAATAMVTALGFAQINPSIDEH